MATYNANTYPSERGAPLAKWGRAGSKLRYLRAHIKPGAAVTTADTVNLGVLKAGAILIASLSFQLIAAGATGVTGGAVIKAAWKNRDGTDGTADLLTVDATAPATGVAWSGAAAVIPPGADIEDGSDITITYSGALAATADVEVCLAYVEHADQ